MRSDIKKLKILLILLTLSQLLYIGFSFIDITLATTLNSNYKLNWFVFIFHYLLTILFIWYIWKKTAIKKKKKTNFTFMIIFLGIVGMWLWLPNKNELKKLYLQ